MLACRDFLEFSIVTMDKEPLPESEVIFQDTSTDGTLAVTIWRDPTPVTELMIETKVAAMGILRIYSLDSLELLHEERIPLSESCTYGPGPLAEEVAYWSELIERYKI